MSMQNIMDFGSGPGGAMVSGKWMHRGTGDIINVRDSFIDDSNNMYLLTDKGQLSMEEFSKYYVQASDEIYDLSGKVVDNKPIQKEEMTSVSVDNIELKPDPIFQNFNNNDVKEPKQNINNFDLIDKIFKKKESKPTVDLKIDWTDFPNYELSMLVDYFDVKREDIATYIGKYLINSDLLSTALTSWLNENLVTKSE